jgi:FdhD protein
MGCPVIASRNSPTSMSVAMAEAWNVTLIGYVRQGSMRVYAHAERLGLEGEAPAASGIKTEAGRVRSPRAA